MYIDNDKCINCRKCLISCPAKAIVYTTEYKIRDVLCINCGACLIACRKVGAISAEKPEILDLPEKGKMIKKIIIEGDNEKDN